jgi:ATP-dependent Clp protease ATP-binding subunit ClpA
MDYARLTDNRGQKADFRNVVLIMTSNAGAQYASQANIGFQSKVSRGEAMMAQVKRTFKPEFLNRLSGTVVFRDMDEEMASMILDKKLRELEQKLKAKNVTLTLNDEARAYLLEKGFTREYGAREMDRVIGHDLKPLLMREILFGQLQKGGEAQLCLTDGELALTSQPALPETDVKELPETI